MEIRQVGPLSVSSIGLGCMPMAGNYGPADEAEVTATLHRAIELGVNFFDTAEIYGPFRNEEQLGRAFADRRDRVILATKFGFGIAPDGSVGGTLDGSPAAARRACEGSLRRLKTDVIDLYYLHRLDPAIPIEDTVGGMADLVREGKIRAIGLSEVSARTLRRASQVHPIAALQSEYSVWERRLEPEILPVARELGTTLVGFSPLGRGFLTGTVQSRNALSDDDFRRTDPRYEDENLDRNQGILEAVRAVATDRGVSPAQIALAWILAQGGDIVPIPGAKRRATLEDSMAAANIVLSGAELEAIEAACPIGATAGERYSPIAMKTVDF